MSQTRTWAGDPGIAWNVELAAELAAPPQPVDVQQRLASLAAARGWAPPTLVRRGASVEELLGSVRPDDGGCPVAVGLAGRWIVLSAHHSTVDGLGMLALLGELAGIEVTAYARGVGDRPERASLLRAVVGRVVEVAFRPPLRVTPTRMPGVAGQAGDSHAARDVDAEVRVGELAYAATHGLLSWQRGQGRRSRRVALAVGVSRAGGDPLEIRDDSALLRRRAAERLSRESLTTWLRTSAVEPPESGTGAIGALLGPLIRLAHRLAWRRLGSTLLVSHLGRIEAPDVRTLRFYPVSGGGSGLSLGAATLHGTTTLTLRARGRDHDDDGLEELLEAVVEQV